MWSSRAAACAAIRSRRETVLSRARTEQQICAQDEEADRVEKDRKHRDGDDLAVVGGVALDGDVRPQPRSDSAVNVGERVAREGFECDVRDEMVDEEHQHQQRRRCRRHNLWCDCSRRACCPVDAVTVQPVPVAATVAAAVRKKRKRKRNVVKRNKKLVMMVVVQMNKFIMLNLRTKYCEIVLH